MLMPIPEPDVYVLNPVGAPRLKCAPRSSHVGEAKRRAAPVESPFGVWAVLLGITGMVAVVILGVALVVSKREAGAWKDGAAQAWSVTGSLLAELKSAQGQLTEAQGRHASTSLALEEEGRRARQLDEDLLDTRQRHAATAEAAARNQEQWRAYGGAIETRLEAETAQRQRDEEEAKREQSRLRQQGSALARENETIQQRNDRLQADIIDAQRLVETLRADRDQIANAMQRLRSRESALAAENSRLQSVNVALERQVLRLESCLAEMRGHMAGLSHEGVRSSPRERRP